MCTLLYPPLSARVHIAKSTTRISSYLSAVQRPEVYKERSNEQMEKAYQAVMQASISIRCAATEYDIPRTTLGDRLQGRVLPGSVSVRQPCTCHSKKRQNWLPLF